MREANFAVMKIPDRRGRVRWTWTDGGEKKNFASGRSSGRGGEGDCNACRLKGRAGRQAGRQARKQAQRVKRAKERVG